MKQISLVYLVFVLIGVMLSNPVFARGGGGHGGGHFGGGHFGGGHFGGGFGGGYHGGGWGYGGHHHGGWGYTPFLGFGLGYGLGYGSGYYGSFYPWSRYGNYYGYYPSTVITVPPTPPVYIQQPRPPVQQYQSGYWYYCSNPDGYYPYVKECLTQWQPVEPRPSVPR